MGLLWDLIRAGERIVAYAESWEVTKANEQHAGFVELTIWRTGHGVVVMGERLELSVNGLACGWDTLTVKCRRCPVDRGSKAARGLLMGNLCAANVCLGSTRPVF